MDDKGPKKLTVAASLGYQMNQIAVARSGSERDGQGATHIHGIEDNWLGAAPTLKDKNSLGAS